MKDNYLLLIFIIGLILGGLVVYVFQDDRIVIDNIHSVTYFNQTNSTLSAVWKEDYKLYNIGKNMLNQVIISEPEVCNKDIIGGDGMCRKYWSNLNEGEIVIVIIQKNDTS